jgi:hypothetical protein
VTVGWAKLGKESILIKIGRIDEENSSKTGMAIMVIRGGQG